MEPLPIACSLSAEDLADRSQAWARLLGGWATGREDVDSGIRIRFRAAEGLERSLLRLVGLEAECCPWMGMELGRDGDLVLTVTAPDEAVPELRRMFSGAGASARD